MSLHHYRFTASVCQYQNRDESITVLKRICGTFIHTLAIGYHSLMAGFYLAVLLGAALVAKDEPDEPHCGACDKPLGQHKLSFGNSRHYCSDCAMAALKPPSPAEHLERCLQLPSAAERNA